MLVHGRKYIDPLHKLFFMVGFCRPVTEIQRHWYDLCSVFGRPTFAGVLKDKQIIALS